MIVFSKVDVSLTYQTNNMNTHTFIKRTENMSNYTCAMIELIDIINRWTLITTPAQRDAYRAAMKAMDVAINTDNTELLNATRESIVLIYDTIIASQPAN